MKQKLLTLGYSPCPNDTFMFEALVHDRIDEIQIQWKISLADIEELNRSALQSLPDVTKVSAALYPYIANEYVLLDAGSALGNHNGPLLVSKKEIAIESLSNCSIAIPGTHTTANLLLTIAFPEAQKKEEVLFSQIENKVADGTFDLGLIIHESRFTYQSKGLLKVLDLGEYWEQQYQQLVPLGCIVARRSLPDDILNMVQKCIKKSVMYAFRHPHISKPYCKVHAQELADEVIKQHIELYVNDYSISLGIPGRKAFQFLFDKGYEMGLLPKVNMPIFAG